MTTNDGGAAAASAERVADIQRALKDAGLDGWLFYDFRQSDPLAYRILKLDPKQFSTRRWFYFVPAEGEPRKLVHRIESGKLDALPGTRREYSSWQELEQNLEDLLAGASTIAPPAGRCASTPRRGRSGPSGPGFVRPLAEYAPTRSGRRSRRCRLGSR